MKSRKFPSDTLYTACCPNHSSGGIWLNGLMIPAQEGYVLLDAWKTELGKIALLALFQAHAFATLYFINIKLTWNIGNQRLCKVS